METEKKVVKKKATPKVKATIFETLSSINVNSKVDKRNGFNYLSWAFAWSEFKKNCPDATYKIIKTEGGDLFISSEMGIMVQTSVTTNGETHEMWLPVMDGSNKAMKNVEYSYKVKEYINRQWTGKYIEKMVAPATMFDINKTLMRCLVKNLAMFGLGIYIYSREDLPENYTAPKPTLDKTRFNASLKAIKDGTFTEEKLIDKFDLTDKQLIELENYMIQIEKSIEDLATSIEEGEEYETDAIATGLQEQKEEELKTKHL